MSAKGRNGIHAGKVEITSGFLLLMAWLNYTDSQGILLWTVMAAAAHELGHWLAARLLGVHPVGLRLSAVGAELILRTNFSYPGEILCALAGPCVNLLLAILFSRIDWPWATVFAGINLVLGLFNLLPVCRLDGGRILYCALVCLLGLDRGVRLKERTDGVCVALCLLLGLWIACAGGNLTLLIIGVWLAVIFKKVPVKRVVKERRNR